jgi:hypothetical protein
MVAQGGERGSEKKGGEVTVWSLAQWFAWMCTSMPRGLRRTCFVDVVRRYKHRHARVRVDAGLYEPRGDRGRHYEQGGCRGTTTTVPYTNRRTESFIRFMLRMSPCCCCRRSHMGSRAHEATLMNLWPGLDRTFTLRTFPMF